MNMSSDPQSATCLQCGRPLPDGVRFCVACGKHNVDQDEMARVVASCDSRVHRLRRIMDGVAFWIRRMYGIRR
ncbi:MAG: zinc ribbon domain-containing protein [Planctomycetales bacterium]|nr:zinc ribbon domain-containing protein [Planctomycetales bacterium]